MSEVVMSVREHLLEMKSRLVFVVIWCFAVFFIGFMASKEIISFILSSFGLPSAVAISPTSYIIAQVTVSFYVMLVLSIPFILVQAYLFARPVLSENPKKVLTGLFFKSLLLGLVGGLFGFLVFARISLEFFGRLPGDIVALWTVNSVVGYVAFAVFSFALAAQITLVLPLLVRLGFVELETFKKSRKMVLLLMMVLAAVFTPPDPWTQMWMVLPMYVCFEAGILVSGFDSGRALKKDEVEGVK